MVFIPPSKRRRVVQASKASEVDRWFTRASHLSQVLLLFLGIFGYFYTVLPLYQKALLDEDIAQKTIELKQKSAELGQKTSQVGALEAEISGKTAELRRREAELSSISANFRLAQAEKNRAQLQAEAAGIRAETNYVKLRREYLSALVSRLRGCGLASIVFGPRAGEFRPCVDGVLERMKPLFAELKPEEYVQLQSVIAKILPAYEAEYADLVTQMEEKLTPLRSELKPIDEAYKNKAFPVNSKEWNAAIEARFGRGRKIEEDMRAIQKTASDGYYKMLDRFIDQAWKMMWNKS